MIADVLLLKAEHVLGSFAWIEVSRSGAAEAEHCCRVTGCLLEWTKVTLVARWLKPAWPLVSGILCQERSDFLSPDTLFQS